MGRRSEGLGLRRLSYLQSADCWLILQLQAESFGGLELSWSLGPLRLLRLRAIKCEDCSAGCEPVREKYLLKVTHPLAVHQVDLKGVIGLLSVRRKFSLKELTSVPGLTQGDASRVKFF